MSENTILSLLARFFLALICTHRFTYVGSSSKNGTLYCDLYFLVEAVEVKVCNNALLLPIRSSLFYLGKLVWRHFLVLSMMLLLVTCCVH